MQPMNNAPTASRRRLIGSGTGNEEKRMSSKYNQPPLLGVENVSCAVRPANDDTSPASRPPAIGTSEMSTPSRVTRAAPAPVPAETRKLMDSALAGTKPV